MEKRLFKISWVDFILYALLVLIFFSVMTFILSLVLSEPFLYLISKNGVLLTFYSLIFPLIQVSTNRNAVLVITDIEYLSKCTDQLDQIICSKGYLTVEKSSNYTKYNRKTKFGRFFNLFLRENVVVREDENKISIYSKKNTLVQIESKIKKLK